jgi:hypothetical protein
MPPRPPPDDLLPEYVLMELFRYAIWDRSKVIMAISAAIWFANLGFQVAGKLNLLHIL